MKLQKIQSTQYEEFAKQIKQDHFLHSIPWAKARQKINWNYEILGLIDQNQIKACAIIMYKKFPYINKQYAYAPRGFILDYQDEQIFEQFTKEMKNYLKEKKVVSLTVDPDIVYNHLDNEYNIRQKGENIDLIIHNFEKNGYKHQGFYNDFEGLQPRHTFRIDTKSNTYEELIQKMNKSTKRYINLSEKLKEKKDLKVIYNSSEALDEFYELMVETTKRDGFTTRNKQYYKNIIDEFGDSIQIISVVCNPKKLYEENIKDLKENIDKIKKLNEKEELNKKQLNKKKEIENKIEKLNKQKDELSKYKFDEQKILASAFMLIYNDKAWYLYGASSDDLRDYRPSYLVYNEMIKTAYKYNLQFLDLFGVGGTLNKNSHTYGLYQIKKGFGGDLIEFIGEYDLIINKSVYTLYKKVFPIIKKLRKKMRR